MRGDKLVQMFSLSLVLVLSGCVVRTYKVTKERIDQDLTVGNRGYISGQTPQDVSTGERKSTRQLQIVEVELHSPVKFEKAPEDIAEPVQEASAASSSEDNEVWGNRGYISGSYESDAKESEEGALASLNTEKYTVQKNDTLQKISQKYFGTTKRWIKIFEVNKDTLSGPDKIYPGQVINIPVETAKKYPKNLK